MCSQFSSKFSHTHMHIHRTNSNHPKPVDVIFLPLPQYNNPDGNTPHMTVEHYGSRVPNSALLDDLSSIPKKEEGRGGLEVCVGGWGVRVGVAAHGGEHLNLENKDVLQLLGFVKRSQGPAQQSCAFTGS